MNPFISAGYCGFLAIIAIAVVVGLGAILIRAVRNTRE